MLQLTYISTATPSMSNNDVAHILAVSRRNNARAAVTGLLFFNGRRFLQALEGPEDTVEQAIARIKADRRHAALVMLSRRTVESREFGGWAMAALDTDDVTAQTVIDRVDALTVDASPNVRAQFTSFARFQPA